MPAIRREGLYFNNTPWESFPSPKVQEILSPLHALGLQFGGDTGGGILLAFPVMAYEIVNDLAINRDEQDFVHLHRHVPLLSTRLLAVCREYLSEPPRSWDIRRALLQWSNRVVWVQPARWPWLSARLADFKILQEIIHRHCPQLRAINADLLRKRHYYDLRRELKEIWGKWLPNIEAALLVNRYYRVKWLEMIAPVLKAAEIV